jgi:hypothetical protein
MTEPNNQTQPESLNRCSDGERSTAAPSAYKCQDFTVAPSWRHLPSYFGFARIAGSECLLSHLQENERTAASHATALLRNGGLRRVGDGGGTIELELQR